MQKEKKDIEELINYYFSSRATEFSRFFTGLTGAILTALSIYTLEKQLPIQKRTLDKGNRVTIAVSLSIALALVTGLSVTGLLQSTETQLEPDLMIPILSSEWKTTQTEDISKKTVHITNILDKPITLRFITENWSPIQARNHYEISWDYDGTPIFPGRGVDIVFTLVNTSNNCTTRVSLDIIITVTML